MTFLAYAMLALGVLAIAQGCFALWNGARFRAYVNAELAREPVAIGPRVALILPCKGCDHQLESTLAAVLAQRYAPYDVVCAVESEDDPARAPIDRAAALTSHVRMHCVTAGPATGHSQKIANLLSAIETIEPEVEVFVFLDSDAVPHPDWLASLVQDLGMEGVGATTGYRWYVPTGTWASLLRSVWNASTLTFLGDHGRNFCWGGSTAIRRETFERLGIAQRWRRVLSDDYEITRAVRAAGLRIRFTPRCVIPTDEPATWRSFWQFARRQMIITRVCSPKVWTAGAIMGLVFNVSFWGLLTLGIWEHDAHARLAAAEWALIYAMAAANGTVRQYAVARIFPNPAQRRGTIWGDVLGAPVVGLFNLALIAASAWGRRFWWRGTLYDVRANDAVKVLRRAS